MPWGTRLSVAVLTISLSTALTAAVVGSPPAAHAADTASVSGRLTAPGGAPLAGQAVDLLRPAAGDSWEPVASAQSDGSGRYTVSGVPAGTYRLAFAQDGQDGLVPEYWPDAGQVDGATDLVVRAGQALAGKDAVLATQSVLELSLTPAPSDEVEVTAYQRFPRGWRAVASVSDTASMLVLDGLHSGTYRVGWSAPGHLTTYWPGSATVDGAGDIAIGDAATVTRSGQLLQPSSISGEITTSGELSGDALLYRITGSSAELVSTDTSAGLGSYEFSGLHPGEYRVDCCSNYPIESVHVTLGAEEARDDVDFHLTGATVHGTVRTGPDTPAAGATVALESNAAGTWMTVATTATAGDGKYAFERLAAGSYRLAFHKPFAPEQVAERHSVTLSHEQDLTVDRTLPPGGVISGQVTDGSALEGVEVRVYHQRSGAWVYADRSAYTDGGGDYTLTGLPQGSYRIGFAHPDYGNSPAVFWDQATTVAGATSIALDEDDTVTGRNAELRRSAEVSGVVTDVDGEPLEFINVTAHRLADDGTGSVASADGYTVTTDETGAYAIDDLLPGTYALEFRDDGGTYLTEYGGEAVDLETAERFELAAEESVAWGEVRLATGSRISGVATTGGGAPIAFLQVWLGREPAGAWVELPLATTDDDGAYLIEGLPRGNYRLRFRGLLPDGSYVDQAQEVELADQDDLTVNPVLSAGGTVNGLVTDADSNGLEGVTVTVSAQQGGGWTPVPGSERVTGTTGHYATPQLTAGTYRVEFSHPDKFGQAVVVQVTGASVNQDVALTGASLRGVVIDEHFTPLAGIEVTAFAAAGPGWSAAGTATTDADGFFSLQPLAAGTYTLRYRDPAGEHLTEFYDDAAELDTAGTVTLGPDEVMPLDATLDSGSSIFGSLSTKAGNAPLLGRVHVYQILSGSWTEVAQAQIGSDRAYRVTGLEPGTFRLEFTASGDHLPEFYNDRRSLAEADDIVLGAGTVAGDRDAVLDPVPPVVRQLTNSAAPAIGGTAKVGVRLTAQPGTWSPGPVALSYQWLDAGVPIPGAVGASYTPAPGQVGHRLSLAVTARTSGIAPAESVSAATGTVAPGTLVAAGRPVIKGKAVVGKTLRSNAGAWTPAPATFTYRWYAGKKLVKTGKALKLKKVHAGKRITLKVTAAKPGYTSLTKASKATAKVRR